jgi:ATP-dependent Clp protease ATP-binding subunit ClpA
MKYSQSIAPTLTEQAKNDQLEPLIGRQTELHEMITVMARRFKANVLMVGDPGVGKTCIVDGLAQEIIAGRVPKFIQDHEVWGLEIGSCWQDQSTAASLKKSSRL